MYLSCGCGQPHESHGDPRHITMQKLEEAAKASEISTEEAARNINEGAQSEKSEQSQRR
jgi:hypothetical protein